MFSVEIDQRSEVPRAQGPGSKDHEEQHQHPAEVVGPAINFGSELAHGGHDGLKGSGPEF